MSKPPPARYRTTNWSDYNAALRKRGSLSVWFDPDMVWQAEKSGKRGRPETFSDAAIQTCLTLKVLFGGFRFGETVGLVGELGPDGSAQLAGSGLFDVVPPAGSDRGADPDRASGQPLNLLIPSRALMV